MDEVLRMEGFYDKIIGICEKYLSSGAKDFLNRQIATHLNKTPEALMPTDKTELAKWCKISGRLVLGNEKSEQLSKEILSA